MRVASEAVVSERLLRVQAVPVLPEQPPEQPLEQPPEHQLAPLLLYQAEDRAEDQAAAPRLLHLLHRRKS